ncbi:MAG: endo-1,4-beta-xylanase [Cyclobacteriaceae bacterium]|nr:endo-1,4-beta-xylanase [Cyclobacteriaceae bacterium]
MLSCKAFLTLLLIALLFSCSNRESHVEEEKGLKDFYGEYFPMGVAVSPRALSTDEAGLIVQQFNSITAENAMKMGPIHPQEDEYFWKHADSIVAFAERNKMKIRGHTLCWHNQTPAWMFIDADSNWVSKEVLLARLKDHITSVVSRYRGKIYAWDVVNEVISDKKDEFYRDSPWYKICGSEFITKAFEYAHAADPEALLFYNDYNEIDPVKRKKIIQLVAGLRAADVPVHGVGLQGHWSIYEPSYARLDSALTEFSALGIPLQITELDVSVYPKEHGRRERKPEDDLTDFTPEKDQKQSEAYKTYFEVFRKHKDVITGVTFWNISDRHSWLDNFPVRNRKDHPLLFDKDLQPKKAYHAVADF